MLLAKEPYWISVQGKLVGFIKPFIDAVQYSPKNEKGIKFLRPGYCIYQAPKETVDLMSHTGRYAEHRTCFPSPFQRIIEENNFDLVFFIETENNEQYIIKPFQSCSDAKAAKEEWEISNTMSLLRIGPRLLDDRFKVTFGSHMIELFVEECFSLGKGWKPLTFLWKDTKKHSGKFVVEYAKLLRLIHKEDIIYNESLFHHIFVNRLSLELKLIDFGEAFKSKDISKFDDEVERALWFLKEQLFPPEDQQKFLETYQKDFRIIRRKLNTETVIKDGKEYKWHKAF